MKQQTWFLGGLAATVVLISITALWLINSDWLELLFWHRAHGNHALVGDWMFEVPRGWYLDSNEAMPGGFSRQLGIQGLGRMKKATVLRESSTLELMTQFQPAVAYRDPEAWPEIERKQMIQKGYSIRDPIPFQLQKQTAQCLMGVSASISSTEPHYVEYCLFADAKIFIIIKASSTSDLEEAAAIIRTGYSLSPSKQPAGGPRLPAFSYLPNALRVAGGPPFVLAFS